MSAVRASSRSIATRASSRASGAPRQAWTPRLMKAAYNYQFVFKDPGAYAHNPTYATQLLHDALADLGAKVKVDIAKAARP